MLSRPTVHLSWDDLDVQGCGEDGTPDWSTLVVVGPNRHRDSRGRVTLEWKVTVQCRETSAAAQQSPQPSIVAAAVPA